MKHLAFIALSTVLFLGAALPAQAATVTFTPSNTTLTPNAASAVDVNLNVNGASILGFTFRIDVTGTVPANIVLNPASITTTGNALELFTNPPIVTDITGGKRFTLSMTSPLSDADGYTNNTAVKMATFNFTAPSSGSLTFTLFNTSEVTDATSYANLLSGYPTKTYTVTAPSNTPTQTPVPTATLTQTPAPTATVTQGTSNGSVTVQFMLEGISSNGKAANAAAAYSTAQNITVRVYNNQTNALLTTSNQSLAPDATGKFISSSVTGLPFDTPLRVCVKAESHLQRCTKNPGLNARFATHPTLTSTQTSASVNLASDDLNHLKAGDIDNNNELNLNDANLLLSMYQGFPAGSFESQVTSHTSEDINHDGVFNIQDIALQSINYTDFAILGDQ